MKLIRRLFIKLFFRPKFEYKTFRYSKEYRSFNDSEELNELGKQGWEAYSVVPTGSADIFYLKRRV